MPAMRKASSEGLRSSKMIRIVLLLLLGLTSHRVYCATCPPDITIIESPPSLQIAMRPSDDPNPTVTVPMSGNTTMEVLQCKYKKKMWNALVKLSGGMPGGTGYAATSKFPGSKWVSLSGCGFVTGLSNSKFKSKFVLMNRDGEGYVWLPLVGCKN